MKTMTDAERVEHLKKLGLKGDGETLAAVPQEAPPTHRPVSEEIVLAPPGVDPRAMPVDDIVFDPHLLDQFPTLDADGRRAAAAYIHSLYRSYQKGDRNKVLHAKINKFLNEERMKRKAPGVIKEVVKTTAEQRALAQVIAATGLTAEDLAKILEEKA